MADMRNRLVLALDYGTTYTGMCHEYRTTDWHSTQLTIL